MAAGRRKGGGAGIPSTLNDTQIDDDEGVRRYGILLISGGSPRMDTAV
jgi:hypothetical protein